MLCSTKLCYHIGAMCFDASAGKDNGNVISAEHYGKYRNHLE